MRYPVRAIPRVESQRNKPRLQGGTECDKLETPGLCEIGVLRAERKARNRRNLFESRRHLARFQTNRHFGGASLISSAPEVQREPISQQPLIFWFFCIKTKEQIVTYEPVHQSSVLTQEKKQSLSVQVGYSDQANPP